VFACVFAGSAIAVATAAAIKTQVVRFIVRYLR
jgi:hypothetical protein